MKKVTPGNSYFSHNPPPLSMRSKFDRSRGNKFDFDAGLLIPFFSDLMLPGDTFQGKQHAMVRMISPLEKPIMDNLYLDFHYFFTPLRILQEDFTRMMGERKPNTDSTIDFTTPKLTDPTPEHYFTPYSNFDYLGYPTLVTNIFPRCHAYNSRALSQIYNEWYRDANLQNMIASPTDNGPDNIESLFYQVLLPRGLRKDYFTSCLAEPQKGPAPTLPIDTIAPVTFDSLTISRTSNATKWEVFQSGTNTLAPDTGIYSGGGTGSLGNSTTPTIEYSLDPNNGLTATLTDPIATLNIGTINQLRTVEALQNFLERDNRGGTRFSEGIFSQFGVELPDKQWRPEFLGGGTLNISVNPVTQSTASPETPTSLDAQGNLAAYATASTRSGNSISFNYSAKEWGIVMGIMSVRADQNYQQGLPHWLTLSTRLDFPFPAFSQLGDEAVLNEELIATGTSVDDDVFGYQQRYGWAKFGQNYISGGLRSNYPTSLDNYHLAIEWPPGTELSGNFISAAPPIGRIVAVPSEKAFIADTFLELYCTRPLAAQRQPGWAPIL